MFGSRSCDYSSENSFFLTANPATSIIYFIKFVLRAVFFVRIRQFGGVTISKSPKFYTFC